MVNTRQHSIEQCFSTGYTVYPVYCILNQNQGLQLRKDIKSVYPFDLGSIVKKLVLKNFYHIFRRKLN